MDFISFNSKDRQNESLHRKFYCSASLKSPEEFDHSFFSNYTGYWHDKHIREQMLDLNPSKIDTNGSAVFFYPPFIKMSFFIWLLTRRKKQYEADNSLEF